MKIVVTGAAGFIGSNLVHHLRAARPAWRVVSLDKLTYSGNRESLADLEGDPGHCFARADICDRDAVRDLFEAERPDGVIHLAAESHVDRSIAQPLAFLRTNVEGTAVLLEEAARCWAGRTDVRFHHVSTDEVFGSLGAEGAFSEESRYDPRSPYAASKAASDHFVRTWRNTYKLPIVITNCSNNYGPYQLPEKLIPLALTRAIDGLEVPVYGRGENVRDWLYVADHCEAILAVFERGREGATYCIGGGAEARNIDLVELLLGRLDRARGAPAGTSRALIRFVEDRPGHDFRYAMDASLIARELGWRPRVPLETGLDATVAWYLAHERWWRRVQSGAYREFMDAWYGGRLAEKR
jgi:dTDP-glucose 4,6-dehydratase